MRPDFGRTAADYASHRAGFPDELFRRLEGLGVGLAGQRLLDLGTGSGALARVFARRGCRVVGLDVSPELIREAERLDAEVGVRVRYVVAAAEATGLPDGAFDAATAAVCWHWFDAPRASAEVRRILVPGGRLAIVHFDWLAEAGGVVEATETLIRRNAGGRWKHDALGIARRALARFRPFARLRDGAGLYPDRLITLAAAGFGSLESFSFDTLVPYSHEAWRGRIRSHAEVGASLGPERVARLDAELQRILRERHPQEPLRVPHRIFVVIGRAP